MDTKIWAIIVLVVIAIAAIGSTVAYQQLALPTTQPTATTTPNPTSNPTFNPTMTPTSNPTTVPTTTPTTNPPTSNPTTNPTQNPTPTASPSPTPNPIASFQLQNGYSGIGTLDFTCWVNVNITRIPNLSGVYFIIQYKESTDPTWVFFHILEQPQSGDIFYQTPPLKENTLYDFRVSWSQYGPGPFSEVQQIKTTANTVPYPAPINVKSTGILGGVDLTWDDIRTQYPHANYIIYNNTLNDPATATKLVRTANPWYIWQAPNSNSYVPQYFWVSSISPSNVESVKVQADT